MPTTTAQLSRFYSALKNRQFQEMEALYHNDVVFNDPVFKNLNKQQAMNMWKMFFQKNDQLTITYEVRQADDASGEVDWQAMYPFSQTGRKVHNKIRAVFQMKDGQIIRHQDSFNLWRWSQMALGTTGYLLGWTALVQNKIRRQANSMLDLYVKS